MLTIDECIDIAHTVRDPFKKGPRPDPHAALAVLRASLTLCRFDWITGRQAVAILAVATGDHPSQAGDAA